MQSTGNALSRMARDRRVLVALGSCAIALVLLVGINLLANFGLRGVRADLTENGLFTLADGSKKILAAIDEPITLRFFRSKELTDKYIAAYAQRVAELLVEYRNASGGKLEIQTLDPEPYSETEEECFKFGIQGVPVAEGNVYFGIAGTNSVGDEQVIPFLDPSKEDFLEYELTKLISSLASPSKLVIGVLSALPIEGQADPMGMNRQAPPPWFVMDQIRQTYTTKTLYPGMAEIPADVNVLLVVHPKGLPESTQYAIDQYVLRGGKALVSVDPFCEADAPPQDPNNPMARFTAQRSSDLKTLFTAWGLQMAPDKIAGDRRYATSVRWNNQGRAEDVKYVCWLSLDEGSVNKEEVTTSELRRVTMKSAGILEPLAGATTQFVPLLSTSEDSMEIATSQIQFQPDPPALLAKFFPSGKRMTLAARITGKVQSAFPGGKPAAGPDDPPPDAASAVAHLSESSGDINVVVVADADMFDDDAWVNVMNFGGQRMGQKLADNGDFLFNTLDFLHGSTELVSLRARGGSVYPFKVVDDIKREAEANYRAEETRLSEEFQKAKSDLTALVSKSGDDAAQVLASAEFQERKSQLETSLVDISKRLREVRYNLNKDVERLGTWLKFLNIVVVPLLVLVAALFVFVYRANRRKLA